MKRIITFWGLIIALLLSVTASPAQIRFGVKGGVNLANVAISDASSYSIESRVGLFLCRANSLDDYACQGIGT